MKVAHIASGLVAALVLLANGVAQPRQAQFSLTIASTQTEVKGGTEATVSTTLTNTSNRAITLEFRSPLCDYTVEVRDTTGALAPDTDLKRKSDCTNHASGRDVIAPLNPNGSMKDVIPVTALSDMSQPGKYFVQVTWKAPKELGGVLVKSNAIAITVVP
jgi:hypothetical protein